MSNILDGLPTEASLNEVPVETADPLTNPGAVDQSWQIAVDALKELFAGNGGVVSSHALRSCLEQRGVTDARSWVVRLRHYSFDDPDEELSVPTFLWHCHAKSLYSTEAYEDLLAEQKRNAAIAGTVEADDEAEEAQPRPERRRRRQEESRLGAYVASQLEDLYSSEFGPETPNVFDVHSERAGGDLENVDVLGVDWRSPSVIEFIAVEVKLDFTAKLVQQARNYQRFAHRVWIAVPVPTDGAEASMWLRETDPLLFEHVVESGLGILACKRRQGSCYEVTPVHWPRRHEPNPIEKERFVERYRTHLEKAGAIAPLGHGDYPAI